MTIGKKIQFYREKLGLSQEELGQKLLVSGQLVNLWETDKEIPNLDNLNKLKDIFSVSFDEFMNQPIESKSEEKQALEVVEFGYEKLDFKKIRKLVLRPLLLRVIIVILASIVSTAMIVLGDGPWEIVIVVIIFLAVFGFGGMGVYAIAEKRLKDREAEADKTFYKYRIYDKYFILDLYVDGQVKYSYKINFSEIEKIEHKEEFVVLQFNKTRFFIKRSALRDDSFFYNYVVVPKKTAVPKPSKAWMKTVSIVLFVASITSIFGALICTVTLSAKNFIPEENLWIFFTFMPIPIASIVFSVCMKKKGYRFRKNAIVGIIMSAFLFVFGFMYFPLKDMYSHDDQPIQMVERVLGIDIPQHYIINTRNYSEQSQYPEEESLISTSDIYFDEQAVEDFEKGLASSGIWLDAVPTELNGLLSHQEIFYSYDYCIIYNVSTKQINELPVYDGKYKFINILYDAEYNEMAIIEYEKSFVEANR